VEVRYQQDLQVDLRERLRRLIVADPSDAVHEVSLTVNWIGQQPTLQALLAEAEAVEPGLDAGIFSTAIRQHQGFRWPSETEAGRATLVWKLMQAMAAEYRAGAGSVQIVMNYGHGLTGESRFADMWRGFAQRILQPLFDYLTERVGAESSVLYVLERYVRRVEWFDRKELYDRAMVDPQKTEEVYDADLRRFLFTEGINMPFSQAKSASGLSDVVTGLDTDDPLVCEIKVLDGVNRGKRHIASGVNQALQYASDYGKQVAYLVIVNLTGRPLALPTEGDSKDWPSWIGIAGVRIYLLTVRALPTVSASKQGKPTPIAISHSELVDPDATDDGQTGPASHDSGQ
jgi:hypothetical protein